jgi:hypothetical protein
MAPSAEAAALGSAAARATVQPTLVAGEGYLLSSVLIDDGSDPATTFVFTDPALGVGVAAQSSASAVPDGLGGERIVLLADTVGAADASAAGASAFAFATATIHGGFLISNLSGNPIEATIDIDWNWNIALALDDAAYDYAGSRVVMTVFRDGLPLLELVNQLVESASGDFSDGGSWSLPISLDGDAEASYSLEMVISTLAQSSPVAAIPEPGTGWLASIALIGLSTARRTRVSLRWR